MDLTCTFMMLLIIYFIKILEKIDKITFAIMILLTFNVLMLLSSYVLIFTKKFVSSKPIFFFQLIIKKYFLKLEIF